MQKKDQNRLHKVITEVVPKTVITNKNKSKTLDYGYNEKYDIVIISKDGTLGEVYDVQGLKIGLPKEPKTINSRYNKWKAEDIPKELSGIKTIFDWQKRDNTFKSKWVDYIEEEFEKREK